MRHRIPDPRAPRQTPAVQVARVRAGETGQGAAGNLRAARETRQTWYVQPNRRLLHWAVTVFYSQIQPPLGNHSPIQPKPASIGQPQSYTAKSSLHWAATVLFSQIQPPLGSHSPLQPNPESIGRPQSFTAKSRIHWAATVLYSQIQPPLGVHSP